MCNRVYVHPPHPPYLYSGLMSIAAYSNAVFFSPALLHSMMVEVRIGTMCLGNLEMDLHRTGYIQAVTTPLCTQAIAQYTEYETCQDRTGQDRAEKGTKQSCIQAITQDSEWDSKGPRQHTACALGCPGST